MPSPSEPPGATAPPHDAVTSPAEMRADLARLARELQIARAELARHEVELHAARVELEVSRNKDNKIERFLATAVDSLATQIAVINEQGRILAVNRSWRAFSLEHGLQTPDPVTGRFENTLYLFDQLPDEAALPVSEGLRDVIARRRDEVSFEYSLSTSAGDRRFSMQITRFADDGPVRLVLANEDVTPRHLAEDRLRQAQKMDALGRLAGGVAHDFNNVLTAIKINAENLLALGPDQRAERGDLEEISRAADRATALTQQLLAFSRKEPRQLANVDLNAVVGEAERLLRRLIGSNIDLATDLDQTLRPVRADAGQLQQIVMNLAINGRDAMPGGGRLTLQTRNVEVAHGDPIATHLNTTGPLKGRLGRVRHYVQLVVSDTGVGMDPVTKARIFEPFFTTKETGHGTGLGLATVFSIVQQCAGHISVASEAGTGKGTTFRIWLPVSAAEVRLTAEDLEPTTESQAMSKGNETVLIVEDEPSIRRVARLALTSQAYQVLEADSGEEALKLLAQHRDVALVVSDVMMPGMDGSELCAHLQATRPELPIILISGYMADKRVLDQVHKGSISFLQKPFSPRLLVQRVRELLDGQGQPRGAN